MLSFEVSEEDGGLVEWISSNSGRRTEKRPGDVSASERKSGVVERERWESCFQREGKSSITIDRQESDPHEPGGLSKGETGRGDEFASDRRSSSS